MFCHSRDISLRQILQCRNMRKILIHIEHCITRDADRLMIKRIKKNDPCGIRSS
jgi:hypothetical protein